MKKIIAFIFCVVPFVCTACLFDEACDVEAGSVLVSSATGDFYIDAYEASRANATELTAGTGTSLACNYRNTVPWTNVTYADARNACLDAGKRLCTRAEWQTACGTYFPYGEQYAPGTCHVATDDLEPDITGRSAGCKTSSGIYDLSGNVAEWVEGGYLMGGTYMSNGPDGACSSAKQVHDYLSFVPDISVGFRCCSDASDLAPAGSN